MIRPRHFQNVDAHRAVFGEVQLLDAVVQHVERALGTLGVELKLRVLRRLGVQLHRQLPLHFHRLG